MDQVFYFRNLFGYHVTPYWFPAFVINQPLFNQIFFSTGFLGQTVTLITELIDYKLKTGFSMKYIGQNLVDWICIIISSSILTWQVHFSLFTNPNIVKSWLKAMGITYGLCMLILIPMFIATGELNTIPMILVIFAGVIAGISLLGFFIMLVNLGNTSHARFTLTDKQVEYENLDQK